jgi:hypothetical protein
MSLARAALAATLGSLQKDPIQLMVVFMDWMILTVSYMEDRVGANGILTLFKNPFSPLLTYSKYI